MNTDITFSILNQITDVFALIHLEPVSKIFCQIIRQNPWPNCKIKITSESFQNRIFDNPRRLFGNICVKYPITPDSLSKLLHSSSLTIKRTNMNLDQLVSFAQCVELNIRSVNTIIYHQLPCLIRCHTLNLSKTSVIDHIVEQIASAGFCRSINLSDCPNITNQSVKLLGRIDFVYLSHLTNVTDEGVIPLGNCKTLDLRRTNITDRCLAYLTKCLSLDLRHTCVTDAGLAGLSNVPIVKIGGSSRISDQGIQFLSNCRSLTINSVQIPNQLAWMLAQCRHIDLTMSTVTDDSVKLFTHCVYLKLSFCKYVTNSSVRFLGRCPTLLIDNTNVTGECLSYLTECQTLDISGCRGITDNAVIELFDANTVLTNFILNGSDRITDRIFANRPVRPFRRLGLAFSQISSQSLPQLSVVPILNLTYTLFSEYDLPLLKKCRRLKIARMGSDEDVLTKLLAMGTDVKCGLDHDYVY